MSTNERADVTSLTGESQASLDGAGEEDSARRRAAEAKKARFIEALTLWQQENYIASHKAVEAWKMAATAISKVDSESPYLQSQGDHINNGLICIVVM